MDPNTPDNRPTAPNSPPGPQQQATIGEGLQESRLNTDFIDFLKKYGDRAVLLILVVVLAYVGWGYLEKQRVAARDQAFFDLESAAQSESIAALADTAELHDGHGAVASMALLTAAEIELNEARVGRTFDGELTQEEADEKRRSALSRLSKVRTAINSNPSMRATLFRTRWDEATAQIDLGEFDAAKTTLENAAAVAREASLDQLAKLAEKRIGRLDALRNVRPPVPSATAAAIPAGGDGVFDPESFELDPLLDQTSEKQAAPESSGSDGQPSDTDGQ